MFTASPILIDPDVQGGKPCFAGTRVHVPSLFDAIKHGRSVNYFLSQFPAVTRAQIDAVLDRAIDIIAASENAA